VGGILTFHAKRRKKTTTGISVRRRRKNGAKNRFDLNKKNGYKCGQGL